MKISLCEGQGIAAAYRRWVTAYFQHRGHTVVPMPPQGNIAELGDVMFSVNFIPELALYARNVRKPYICWVCDVVVNKRMLDPALASDMTVMFHCSRENLEYFRKAGYRHAFYLPVSVDHTPWAEAPPAGAVKTFPVSFVGHCYRPELTSGFRAYRQNWLDHRLPPSQGLTTLEAFIRNATEDLVTPLRPLFLDFIQRTQPDFFAVAPMPNEPEVRGTTEGRLSFFLDFLLGHEIDALIRGRLVEILAPLGMHLWGEAGGWAPHLREGVQYHGLARMDRDFAGIVAATAVCVNIPRRFSDAVIMRTFEIPACGGFQLSLASDELLRMFEENREVAVFRTLDEARDKARFYLAHDAEREAIARRGRERFVREHTLDHRLQAMEATLKQLGIF